MDTGIIVLSACGAAIVVMGWLLRRDDERVRRRIAEKQQAFTAEPHVATTIRMLEAAGYSWYEWNSLDRCKYCEMQLMAVSGPTILTTPLGEVFERDGDHGVACLRCGYFVNDKTPLLARIEEHTARVPREAYEIELQRLGSQMEDVRRKMSELPGADPYRGAVVRVAEVAVTVPEDSERALTLTSYAGLRAKDT